MSLWISNESGNILIRITNLCIQHSSFCFSFLFDSEKKINKLTNINYTTKSYWCGTNNLAIYLTKRKTKMAISVFVALWQKFCMWYCMQTSMGIPFSKLKDTKKRREEHQTTEDTAKQNRINETKNSKTINIQYL